MLKEHYTGKVTALHPDENGVYVTLSPYPDVPAAGHFLQLPITHKNYTSIYTLLMASAVNKLQIEITIDQSTADYPPITRVDFTFPP